MMILLMAFLPQVALEEGTLTPHSCRIPRFLVASRTGKFVVIGEDTAIHVIDGESLEPVRTLALACTAIGFDEKDATLTIVGKALVRYETKEWRELCRFALPEAAFRMRGESRSKIIVKLEDKELGYEPGQAWVSAEGSVYYGSETGDLFVVEEKAGTFKTTLQTLRREEGPSNAITGVWGMAAPDVLMVALGGISTGIVLKDRVYRLTRSGHPLSVNLMGEQVVLVGREYERVYNATTWKLLWNRPTKNEAVAFDTKRGWIFTAHQTKIRAWRASKPEDQVPFEKTKGSVVALSIDGLSRRLYAADPANLHSWKIGE